MTTERFSGRPMGMPDTRLGYIVDKTLAFFTWGVGSALSRMARGLLRESGVILPSRAEYLAARVNYEELAEKAILQQDAKANAEIDALFTQAKDPHERPNSPLRVALDLADDPRAKRRK